MSQRQYRQGGSTPSRLTTPSNTQGSSPSEAMLEMLRKHKQDVHRIANLAAEISVATETGMGINQLRNDFVDAGSSMRHGSSSGGSPFAASYGTAAPQIKDRSSINASNGKGPTTLGGSRILMSPSSPQRSTKNEPQRSPQHINQTTPSSFKTGGSKFNGRSSSSPRALASNKALESELEQPIARDQYQQSPTKLTGDSSSKQSPEEKQSRMRHAVHDLFQTVQDQRTRAEARGLTLARAL